MAQKSLLGNRPSEKVMTLMHATDQDVARWLTFIGSDIRWCNAEDRKMILIEAGKRLAKTEGN